MTTYKLEAALLPLTIHPNIRLLLRPFCFAVIAGAMMLGLKLVFITIHPMKWGATLMNSFLFNVGLILLCSIRGWNVAGIHGRKAQSERTRALAAFKKGMCPLLETGELKPNPSTRAEAKSIQKNFH